MDPEGRFYSLYRESIASMQAQFGPDFFSIKPYYLVSPESVSVKGEQRNGVSLKIYSRGTFLGRFHFSRDIPFPWLVSAFLITDDGGKALRLTGYGWEEFQEMVDREARATVDDAVTEIVNKALEKAAIGDWALYELLDGTKVRYELVEINRDGDRPRYTDLIQTFDPRGKLLEEERKSNFAYEIANGFVLRGDVTADRFELTRGETTSNGMTMPVLSLTGYADDEPRYRVDLSEDVPAGVFVNLVIFDLSEEPLYHLIDFGRSSDTPAVRD